VAGLHSLAPLAPLRTLRRLSLHDCRTLTDIDALTDMRGLRRLDLSGSAVRDLAPLAGLKDLEEVVLERCSALENIRALLDLPSLRHVSFDGITDWLPMDVIEELKDARSVSVLFDSYLNVGHAGA
jgi:Leucine-rich repeat (LRR) protein